MVSPGVWNKFIAKGIWALEEEHLAMIAPDRYRFAVGALIYSR